jgi:hypothetical protein
MIQDHGGMGGAGSCPDEDTVVTLAVALGEDAQSVLSHLSACDPCRARLDVIAGIRAALDEYPVRAGFADEVVAALPAGIGAHGSAAWIWRSLNAALTIGTAGMVLVSLDAVSSPSIALAVSVAAAVIMGGGAAWRSRSGWRTRAGQPG